jgi:hypothetical protein
MTVNHVTGGGSIVLFWLLFLSCHRNHSEPSQDDSTTYKLKHIAIEALPSPYLQFLYLPDGRITEIRQEANLYQYHLQYKNGRLDCMINKAHLDFDTLKYQYAGNRVVKIQRSNVSMGRLEEISLYYDAAGRLTVAAWLKLATGQVVKKLEMRYGAGDNMNAYDEYYRQGDILVKTGSHEFSGFDEKINVAANLMLKDIHYLQVPGIRLQKNNPSEEKIIGRFTDWDINFRYAYQDSLPISKLATMTITRGDGMGRSITSLTEYAYY